MANRKTFDLACLKSEMCLLSAKLTGAGAADMVNADSANMGGGEVSSAVRTGAGTFNLTFRKKYPELKCPFPPGIVGTTVGLDGTFTAFDPVAGTATLKLAVGNTPTDPASTDTVYLAWIVRNSGLNK